MSRIITVSGPMVGRFMLALIFLWSGLGKISGFTSTAGYMASKGLPMVEVLLVITILIEVGGALMVIVGWKARLAAGALFLWMIPVTLVFHNFWAVPPEQERLQMIMFFKNLAMMGGMIQVLAFGPGPWSLQKEKGGRP